MLKLTLIVGLKKNLKNRQDLGEPKESSFNNTAPEETYLLPTPHPVQKKKSTRKSPNLHCFLQINLVMAKTTPATQTTHTMNWNGT